jgi:hypothetical protein
MNRDAVSSPHRYQRELFQSKKAFLKPHSNFDLIREFSTESDRLLALPFAPIVYIQSGILPALGSYYYLPWQAEYNKNPISNYRTDICSDTFSPRPTFIWYSNTPVWGQYPIEEYEPCIQKIVDNHYIKMGASNIYFPKKFFLHNPFSLSTEDSKRKPSAQLEVDAPIQIKLGPFIQNGKSQIEKIGVRLATYRRTNLGTAELVLSTSSGEIFRSEFSLP